VAGVSDTKRTNRMNGIGDNEQKWTGGRVAMDEEEGASARGTVTGLDMGRAEQKGGHEHIQM
jgi:hypothetical protein